LIHSKHCVFQKLRNSTKEEKALAEKRKMNLLRQKAKEEAARKAQEEKDQKGD